MGLILARRRPVRARLQLPPGLKPGLVSGWIGLALFWAMAVAWPAVGAPTSAAHAQAVVAGWLRLDGRPLGAALGPRVGEAQSFLADPQEALYHVVSLAPSGFVIVAGNDQIEPIIAFAPAGRFDPSPQNPLYALVNGDLPAWQASLILVLPGISCDFSLDETGFA